MRERRDIGQERRSEEERSALESAAETYRSLAKKFGKDRFAKALVGLMALSTAEGCAAAGKGYEIVHGGGMGIVPQFGAAADQRTVWEVHYKVGVAETPQEAWKKQMAAAEKAHERTHPLTLETGELVTLGKTRYVVVRMHAPELVETELRSDDARVRDALQRKSEVAIARARVLLAKPESDLGVAENRVVIERDPRPDRRDELVIFVPVVEVPEGEWSVQPAIGNF